MFARAFISAFVAMFAFVWILPVAILGMTANFLVDTTETIIQKK